MFAITAHYMASDCHVIQYPYVTNYICTKATFEFSSYM